MKCQILFSGKNKKNIINLSSAENAQRVVKVKMCSPDHCCFLPLQVISNVGLQPEEYHDRWGNMLPDDISRVERKTSVSQMVVFPQT